MMFMQPSPSNANANNNGGGRNSAIPVLADDMLNMNNNKASSIYN
eukprot:CAMPEP_0176363212 /NCGR_PEP_ID=MMETSP0126-20121128/18967_1 /TAXON_ID=141414 ORGANISM="Strombidinopsis acuminatum, Strain SPMC142" /NCGR_SAMPLE_ID=MMETSP0126 /ASSEMBLY_ACC=CAM_ASM_000229 /LENGTH=44 /DNA_ID= /DNA_START= /DNA_END= /DNA_ORIENTATION=